jgi:hypothetical protein
VDWSFHLRILTPLHESTVVSRSGRAVWRRLTAVLCTGLLAFQVGCYSYLPIQETAPQAGVSVAVTLNDRGRDLVGGKLGEEAMAVDGTMISDAGTSITVSVNRVRFMRGSSSIWAGEQVEIPKEGIRGFQERRFSKGRTTMLTIGLLAGLVGVASLIDLAINGRSRTDPPGRCPPDCGPNEQ